MWLSQLAYETHAGPTIGAVAARWGFTDTDPFKAAFGTCSLIAERPDAIVLAFAGTDLGIWQNLVTDGVLRIDPETNVHVGFQEAAEFANAKIKVAARRSLSQRKPLFVAGHSLGAALAALASQVARAEGAEPQAVYTYGMPRTGGETFAKAYNEALGSKTFRLVYGIDVVARVPMSVLGYRHVGCAITCEAGAKFDRSKTPSAIGVDLPAFAGELSGIVRRGLSNLMTGLLWEKPGPGRLGRFYRFLRPEIRDHLQDSYWTALTP